ncbi:MAG: hypothetical protein J6B50_13485 [Lachnospiraceae bacterium]|nr:hypothetical protein [Lachnospiraceae bacterium]MBP3506251.1 hypothetical protein [Lachnospiraceae bacterium]
MPKRNHKPYDIKHSLDGILSCILGGISAILVIGELALTIRAKGQAGGMAGFMGISAFLLTVVGLIFAIVSWKDEETLDLFKRVGTLLNTIMIIVNLLIIVLGIFG